MARGNHHARDPDRARAMAVASYIHETIIPRCNGSHYLSMTTLEQMLEADGFNMLGGCCMKYQRGLISKAMSMMFPRYAQGVWIIK